MNQARSIKQNSIPDALPNFRNLGITLRILLISILLILLLAVIRADKWADVPESLMQAGTLLAPVLLSSLLLLWAVQPWLKRQTYRHGVLAVMGLVLILTLSIFQVGIRLFDPLAAQAASFFGMLRAGLLAVVASAVLLLYFWLRSRVLSRALHDARLQALRARIRPHFLFNTINTVLSILRAQPKMAETALENMSDLFRIAMTDMQDMVPLQRELQLCRQYIDIERLRMGERLGVEWQLRDLPDDALIPPLLLQPLLENAVYHGIEPLPQGGSITVLLRRSGNELHLKVENPCPPPVDRPWRSDATGTYRAQPSPENKPRQGNKMALQNIRERLALLFDAEARYKVESGEDFYRVEIVMPYVKEQSL